MRNLIHPAYAHCDLRDIPALQASIVSLVCQVGPFAVLVNNAAQDEWHDWQTVSEAYRDGTRAVIAGVRLLWPGP
jgi:D-xylose 1-dehydrogenase